MKQLTPQQDAIETAWTAHGWGPLPKSPKGYSGLVKLVQQYGCPLVLAWANVVNGEEPVLPEGADAWECFCTRFREAMKAHWKWDRSGRQSKRTDAPVTGHRKGVLTL